MKYTLHSLQKNRNLIFVALGVIAAFGLGMNVGQRLDSPTLTQDPVGLTVSLSPDKEPLDLDPFWAAHQILNEKFVPTVASSTIPNDTDKVWGAIEGLAAAYGDPYTVFFPPTENKNFNDEVRGDFTGVGMEIAIKDKMLTVVAPLKGTPAEKAGIKSGDIILQIDKKSASGMAVEDAVELIRGPKGTTVVLTLKQGDAAAKDISVVRNTINIPTIDTKLRNDGIFVISLYNFSANSPALFREALREFIQTGTDKLVLDLRNNPGGYLEAAVDMASFFLPIGTTIVHEDFGTKRNPDSVRSIGYNIFTDKLKMVIIINEGSASASEILAGALREHGIAKLVGEKSFGKGSVQELVPITADTSLKVTVARWLTPQKVSISENGITPDFEVELTAQDVKEERDPQLEKAVSVLLDPNFKR